MIWYSTDIKLAKMPQGSIVRLQGKYNGPSGNPIIAITILIQDGSGACELYRTIFEHNPSTLTQEEPNPDDILAKYNPKIQKILARLSTRSYQDTIILFQ